MGMRGTRQHGVIRLARQYSSEKEVTRVFHVPEPPLRPKVRKDFTAPVPPADKPIVPRPIPRPIVPRPIPRPIVPRPIVPRPIVPRPQPNQPFKPLFTPTKESLDTTLKELSENCEIYKYANHNTPITTTTNTTFSNHIHQNYCTHKSIKSKVN
jgi:hypothetical protein